MARLNYSRGIIQDDLADQHGVGPSRITKAVVVPGWVLFRKAAQGPDVHQPQRHRPRGEDATFLKKRERPAGDGRGDASRDDI